MSKIMIEEEFEGTRLDHFMTGFLSEHSRSQIQKFIDSGEILVNEELSKSNYRLKEEDLVSYEIIEESIELLPQDMDLEIIYEDDHLIVLNKEAGIIVHPSDSSKNRITLVNGLLYRFEHLSDLGGDLRPGIVHRLDKDTSGLLMVAKTNDAHKKLVEMLKNREIDREYFAIVHHRFHHKQALVDAPIGRDPYDRKKMTVTHINSKDAKTHLSLIEEFKDFSFVNAKLESGRTHQIRVHCQYIKHPVVGDEIYGYKKTIAMEGHALHAYKLAFRHPITKQDMKFEIGLPKRIESVIEEIRRLD